ncbi:MAG: hypothetical protein WBK67_02955 [Minisyncoccales bacterium]
MPTEIKEIKRTLESIRIGVVGNGFIVSRSFVLEMSNGSQNWEDKQEVFIDKTKMLKAVSEILNQIE